MSAPPPEATGQSVAAATDELKALGIDVIERHCSGRVWPAALTLLEHLTRDDRCLPPSARVLELGAGTGWMALNATKRRPDVRWCATETERENAAERLASNLALATAAARAGADDAHEPHTGYVAENPADVKEKDEPRKPLVAASALDWSRAARSPLLSEPWDVVVGSDLVYGEAGARDLATCLAALLLRSSSSSSDGDGDGDDDDVEKREKAFGSRDESAADAKGVEGRLAPVCFLAQTCGRWGGYGYDAALYESLRRAGLRATPVGGETPRDDDATRQHVCVFSVEPAGGGGRGGGASEAEDEAHHPLLRARRLRAAAEAAAEAGMSEDDRAAAEAQRAMERLEAFP